ncbi:MAG: hypothetical protein HGA29_07845 [Syntrophaceae bacterium]|nr:hypothetical protein [Syntrophaceae bacterium]
MQRYISDELSHFVGNIRNGKSEDEHYSILVNSILKTGLLTYPPHDTTRPRSLSLDFSSSISEDTALKYEVVCFCDIPIADLAIHTGKYGKFGLSFKKDFLLSQGACPVFYVANNSSVGAKSCFTPDDFLIDLVRQFQTTKVMNRDLYYSTSVRAILDIFASLDALCNQEAERFFKGGNALTADECKLRFCQLLGLNDEQISAIESNLKSNDQAKKTITILRDFIICELFSYIKCFNATLEANSDQNYYMEREWRIGNHVRFKLSDVARVFFPSKYAAQFHKDLPDYIGQITFID